MFEVYFHGALRVLVDSLTGEVVAVQDRISGEDASFRFSLDYINAARHAASLAFSSQFSEV